MSPTENLSEETDALLNVFLVQLARWNRSINLVAKGGVSHWWHRHVADSLQLSRFVLGKSKWVDLGTGGGFPGMVLAIWASKLSVGTEFVFIESDARKCEFLRAVSRETGVRPTIINDRIERVEPLGADVVSSRALASLTDLCDMAHRHLKPSGQAIFLKGASVDSEVNEARKQWDFDLAVEPSVTSSDGSVVVIEGISRAR